MKMPKWKQELIDKLRNLGHNTHGIQTVAQLQNIYQRLVEAAKGMYKDVSKVILTEDLRIDAVTSSHNILYAASKTTQMIYKVEIKPNGVGLTGTLCVFDWSLWFELKGL